MKKLTKKQREEVAEIYRATADDVGNLSAESEILLVKTLALLRSDPLFLVVAADAIRFAMRCVEEGHRARCVRCDMEPQGECLDKLEASTATKH